jgi:tetratricopeptide (TPR) repeat protein
MIYLERESGQSTMDRFFPPFEHVTPSVSLGAQGAERFHFVRLIGEGVTSRVFEVIDRHNGGRFALKRLRHERLSPDRVARFKDEFRALERTAHPNLAKVYELIADEHGLALLMELVEGDDFLRYVRPDSRSAGTPLRTTGPYDPQHTPEAETESVGGTLCVERLRDALVQLVRGLRALHATGKIHSDIKPEHVRVTPEGRVVIVDFGLLTEAVREDHWRGTPTFMAPEQFAGIYTEAVDWYATGMLLYAALSDRLELTSSPSAMSYARSFAPPLNPLVHSPHLPHDLVELAMRLVEPQPERRPTGRQLETILGLTEGEPTAPSDTAFVGRGPELARLRAALQATQSGAVRIVHVHGEAGIGKTSLVHGFARQVREAGGVVLHGACYHDASVSYKGLDTITDRVAASAARQEVPISEEDRAVLGRMFPVFLDGPAEAAAADVERDPALLRLRAVAAYRRLLSCLARGRSLVLCIDDIQWSDRESLDLLSEIVQVHSPHGILLVLGYRSHPDTVSAQVQHARRVLPCDEELALGPLDRRALYALVESRVDLPSTELDRLIEESGGNPFFMGELVRARSGGMAHRVPTLEIAISRRLAGLEPNHRVYLELVSVAGRPLDERVLRSALRMTHDETLDMRRALVAASFLRWADDRAHAVQPYHDRVREQLLHELSPERVRALHGTLAAAYEAQRTSDAEILALHYRAAGNDAKARTYAERAGDAALSTLAFDHAAQLFADALAVARGDDAHRLRLKQAKALSMAGRPAEAAGAFESALQLRPNDLDLMMSQGDELLKAGQIEQGLDLLRRVANDLGEHIPKSRIWAALRVLWNWVLSSRLTVRVVPDHEISEQEKRRLLFCMTIVRQLVWIDYLGSVLFCLRHMLLAYQTGSRTDIIQALAHKASFLSSISLPKAERMLVQANALMTPSDPAVIRGVLRFTLAAGIEFAYGRWDAAAVTFDESLEILRENAALRRHWNIAFCQCGIIENLRMRGAVFEIRRRLQVFRAEARGHRTLEAFLLLRGGLTDALCADTPEKASQMVDEIMAAWPTKPVRMPLYFGTVARIEIELYRGNVAAAWQAVPLSWQLMRKVGLNQNAYYFQLQLALEARAALAHGAWDAVARCVRKLRRSRHAWARALGVAFQGCLLARHGASPQAQEVLAQAAHDIDESGLALYAAAARFRLASLTSNRDAERAALHELNMRGASAPERLARSLLPLP